MICFNWCLNREYDGDITGYNGISMAYESGFNQEKQTTNNTYIYIIYPVILEYRIEILASQGIPLIELENSYLEYS